MIVTIVSILALLFFFWKSDFNREPFSKLLKILLLGIVITLQIEWLQEHIFYISGNNLFQAFISAALVEESIKYIALDVGVKHMKEFDEQIDGIVYAVCLSLGFAFAETIIVFSSNDYFIRAITAVPMHALLGAIMGYFLGQFKFNKKKKYFLKAIIYPVFFHGMYDFLILEELKIVLVPFIIITWIYVIKKIEKLGRKSNEVDKKK